MGKSMSSSPGTRGFLDQQPGREMRAQTVRGGADVPGSADGLERLGSTGAIRDLKFLPPPLGQRGQIQFIAADFTAG